MKTEAQIRECLAVLKEAAPVVFTDGDRHLKLRERELEGKS